MTILQHPVLGKLKGNEKDGVTQYLGIKYASLKERFAAAELMEKYEGGVEATSYGSPVISPPQSCDVEMGFIQHSLPKPSDIPPMSDLEGLNLNITLPSDISPDKRLPVLVFIHGGGFTQGSNWWPQNNFSRIVKLSKEIEMPIIGIGINYRLGAPGFLTSAEMRTAGYPANRGLLDQRVALQWIKKHIGGFGGDPENVTVIGESAGGFSVITHLNSREPLFKRVVAMSGNPICLPIFPLAAAESFYTTIYESLGLPQVYTPEDRIKSLSVVPAEDLLTKIPPTAPMFPVLDGKVLPLEPWTFMNYVKALKGEDVGFDIPGREWCESIMIGDCQLDANIFTFLIPPLASPDMPSNFQASLSRQLASSHPKTLEAIKKTFDCETSNGVLGFASALIFYASMTKIYENWPGDKEKWLYHFNIPNPWDGKFKGEAVHILDVALLFQYYREHLSPETAGVAKQFAEDVIKFTSGTSKVAFNRMRDAGEEKVIVFEEKEAKFVDMEEVERTNGAAVGRKRQIFAVAEMEGLGLDGLMGVWNGFLQGK